MRGWGLTIVALGAVLACSLPARAEAGDQTVQAAPSPAAVTQAAPSPAASAGQTSASAHPASSRLSNAEAAVKAEVKALVPMTLRERRVFERASAEFPGFCRDWERKLRDREVNNLANLAWSERNGYETASYVGYGPIEKCQCHESRQGVPIGELIYKEIHYYLVGKTKDEAKRAKPKTVGEINTLEIFSWDRNRWFY